MRVVKAGTADVSVVIRIIDATDGTPETGVVYNTAGIDLEYRREGAVSVDITEASLAALTDAHSDGGFLHIGNGYYRLDLPDAASAVGVTGVLIHGTVTGMVVIGQYIQLVTYDPFDGVRLGLTALPNAAANAAGGLPVSDAGGVDLDALAANAAKIPAARTAGTADSGTTTTMVDSARTEGATDYWKGSWLRFISGGLTGQTRLITGFTPATDTITFYPPVATAVTTHGYEIIPAGFGNVLVDWIDGGRLDLLIDAIKAKTDGLNFTGTDVKATLDGETVDVGKWVGTVVTLSDTTGKPEVDAYSISDNAITANSVEDKIAYLATAEDVTDAHATTDGKINALHNLSPSQAQVACNEALIANSLDHLCKMATAAADMTTEVADNTIIARILANGDTSAFDPSTDGLQPIRDRGDAAWITATGFSTHSAADVATQLGTGTAFTAIPWNADWDAQVQSECADALTAYNAVATTDLPSNFANLAITMTTGRVTVGTNADKTGYSLSGAKSTLDDLHDVSITNVQAGCAAAIAANTVNVGHWKGDPVSGLAGTYLAVADAVLARDASYAEPTGEEHTLRFLILMATQSNTVDNPGFITVYQTDGVTEVCQKAITSDGDADPMTGIS